ncbi:hypothetical protein ACFY6U_13255 [Streptomyces sp. NPDC013157]|uniref:hypothetical protein n=1 Tax=Streptomyces sp. NPDC013157 TaxID=3364861 RepID=UPI0036CEB490
MIVDEDGHPVCPAFMTVTPNGRKPAKKQAPLYDSAVAMTGGQDPVGALTVADVASTWDTVTTPVPPMPVIRVVCDVPRAAGHLVGGVPAPRW